MSDKDKKVSKPGRRYLGEILVESGLISTETLTEALELSKAQGKRVGQVLLEMQVADDVQIAKAISDQLSIPFIKLAELEIDNDVISLVPQELVKHYIVIPMSKNQGSITIIMSNPLDFQAIDDLRFATQMRIETAIAPEQEIIAAIDKYYAEPELLSGSVFDTTDRSKEVIFNPVPGNREDIEKNTEDLLDLSGKAPVVRFTNAIIADAIKLKASDIHIEPQRNSVIIRYRIDGVMREMMKTERHIHTGVVSRIKVVAKMDISIRRAPQDGKLQVNFDSNRYDLRVSTLPTAYGEKVTIRVLGSIAGPESIDELNLSDAPLEDLRTAISQPQGIVLVTGPTGSGKTTTLYTCLKSLMSPEVNIVTLENPIEYDVDGINQVEINEAAGLSFSDGLRSILRQDPDIILLGEIRDEETAHIAFHAAQTGHMVLSTLHTNSAAAAISRLVDLGGRTV
ncbi:MAG: Flp pilus assembly complex ATPase component TadA [Gammaproteobacteria bacterium]|jgi:type IV pilus assembly protein PilB|nr:Flp pilus assembly complex ATPase component TadA [Gammaproteobacteria bacterium]